MSQEQKKKEKKRIYDTRNSLSVGRSLFKMHFNTFRIRIPNIEHASIMVFSR